MLTITTAIRLVDICNDILNFTGYQILGTCCNKTTQNYSVFNMVSHNIVSTIVFIFTFVLFVCRKMVLITYCMSLCHPVE